MIAVAAIALHGNNSVLPGSSSGNTTTTGGSGGGGAVTLSGVKGFDPQGDGTEHDADAPNATDGNQSTFWTTEQYRSQDFSGLGKDGVGLVLDAPTAVALKKLTVTTDTPGFTAVVKAGSSPESAQVDSSAEDRERHDDVRPQRHQGFRLRPVDHAARLDERRARQRGNGVELGVSRPGRDRV